MKDIIQKRLRELGIEIEISDDCFMDDHFRVVYQDKLRKSIEDVFQRQGYDERDSMIRAGDVIEKLSLPMLDSWMAIIESESCENCPAFSWVIHRDGVHPCRLGFEMEEKGEKRKPVEPCLRPTTVGASYQIARMLGRDEPMVGKLDAWQYEKYLAEKGE